MPELPDLQVFSKNLSKELCGKTIKEIKVINSKKLNVSVASLKKAMEDGRIKAIHREGKELRVVLDNGNVLGLHLMLHGQLSLFKDKNEHKDVILSIHFTDDKVLALADYQGLASATLNPELKNAPDALSHELNYEYLKEQLHKIRGSIKNVLIDQKIIRGIGNAYADEILWDARIAPLSASNKIPEETIKILEKSIRKVLQDAEKQILTSHPDIISGEVRDFLLIHNPQNNVSPTGSVIKQTIAGSRKTYYTDEQKLYK
jgi:formamidopyrimidine-DNA glycosylase